VGTRLALGIVIFPHGAQKMLGWYGGNGFSGTMAFFTEPMGMPALVACLVIVGEFFGSLALLIGFLT
jgi:putative oxidoreductase